MKRILSLLVLVGLLLPQTAAAQRNTGRLLMPIGGGYADIYGGFLEAAVENARNGRVRILVLPIAFATNANQITKAEREDNLQAAAEQTFLINEACKQAAPPNLICEAVLTPILVQADALNPAALDEFTDDLSAVFILGGDQTVAMQVIAGTPLEPALASLYEQGVIIAGTSAGAGVQSAAMLAGYNPNYADANALSFGAPDVWHTPEKHGLSFGLQNAIVDQHFYQRSRVGLLLNAISLPGVPHVGIGVDADTGVQVRDGLWLEKVFGLYTVTVLDAETYHAAEGVRYVECPPNADCSHLLSLRNVLVHLLAPGGSAYDLGLRVHSLGAPQPRLERSFEALNLPAGAGTLILAGDISGNLEDSPVMERFVELSGGENARLLVVAGGFPSDASAGRTAENYATALGGGTRAVIIARNAEEPLALRSGHTGIVVVARDQTRLKPELIAPVREAWLNGANLLLDNGAAAVAGAFYSVHGATPEEGEEGEAAIQKSFYEGRTKIAAGLGLLPAVFEVQVMNDNRWGRLFSLAYQHPNLAAFGIAPDSAVEIGPNGARALGENVLLVLDLGFAERDYGTNQAFVIANGLLDVFAPGEEVRPVPADMYAAVDQAPTPAAALAVGGDTPDARSATPTGEAAGAQGVLTQSSQTEAAQPVEAEAASTPGRAEVGGALDWRSLALPVMVGLLLVVGLVAYLVRRD